MLKATDETGNIYLSYEEKSRNKNIHYFCCDCQQKVLFVDSRLKIKHFRHKTKSECDPEPETQIHIQMKKYLAESLKAKPENIEVNLKWAKPDLFFNGFAIEVQHSKISYETFITRTKNYTLNQIPVIWIFDKSFLGLSSQPGKILRKAHELYYGRVYLFSNDKIIPAHFNSMTRYIEPTNFGGGYFRYSKRKKEIVYGKPIETFYLKSSFNTFRENNILVAKFNDEVFWK